jgi:hypothetical protein
MEMSARDAIKREREVQINEDFVAPSSIQNVRKYILRISKVNTKDWRVGVIKHAEAVVMG